MKTSDILVFEHILLIFFVMSLESSNIVTPYQHDKSKTQIMSLLLEDMIYRLLDWNYGQVIIAK